MAKFRHEQTQGDRDRDNGLGKHTEELSGPDPIGNVRMSKKNRPETVAADILDRSWPWMLALCDLLRVLSVRSRHGSTSV